METLDTAGIRKVSPADFLTQTFNEPVYVRLGSADYHIRKEGGHFNREEFHKHPERYSSDFLKFTKVADIPSWRALSGTLGTCAVYESRYSGPGF